MVGPSSGDGEVVLLNKTTQCRRAIDGGDGGQCLDGWSGRDPSQIIQVGNAREKKRKKLMGGINLNFKWGNDEMSKGLTNRKKFA